MLAEDGLHLNGVWKIQLDGKLNEEIKELSFKSRERFGHINQGSHCQTGQVTLGQVLC